MGLRNAVLTISLWLPAMVILQFTLFAASLDSSCMLFQCLHSGVLDHLNIFIPRILSQYARVVPNHLPTYRTQFSKLGCRSVHHFHPHLGVCIIQTTPSWLKTSGLKLENQQECTRITCAAHSDLDSSGPQVFCKTVSTVGTVKRSVYNLGCFWTDHASDNCLHLLDYGHFALVAQVQVCAVQNSR